MGGFSSKFRDFVKKFEKSPLRILLLGLDAAGKTTILYHLKLDKMVKTIPTIGFNVESIDAMKGLSFTVWDVGGQSKLRTLWKHYYADASGLIYVVDSADSSRFEEAKDELFGIISDEQMSRIPILILANKQDISCASTTDVIIDKMCLSEIPKYQRWNITACSAKKGQGVKEGLDVFSKLVKESRANIKSPSKSKRSPSKS